MKYKMMKDGVVVAIVLLFFGVAAAPGITGIISHEPLKDELVEFRINVCGQVGLVSHSIWLTPQQAADVDVLFDRANIDLENANSYTEANNVLCDTMVSLDTYGLLGGFSVQQVQQRVLGCFQPQVNGIFDLEQQRISWDDDDDYLCFVLAAAYLEGFPSIIFINFLAYLGIYLIIYSLYKLGFDLSDFFYNFLMYMMFLTTHLIPVKIMSYVGVQGGFLNATWFGLNGVQKSDNVNGLHGFTGIMLYNIKEEILYLLGFSLVVENA